MSRRTSATSPAGPTSGDAPVYRKPRPDFYTLLLFVAWSALVVATIFLYLETTEYGSPPWQGAPQVSFSAPAAPPAPQPTP